MDTLEKCYGQRGWREFHRNRKNILAEFDKLLEQTSNRPVQAAHGPAVEAFLLIFIDLKESDNNKSSIIEALYAGKDVIGFSGGMVLRYEGDHTCTGLISIHRTESKEVAAVSHCTPLAKPIDSLAIYRGRQS